MKILLYILLAIFTLSESYLIYGFYRFNLNVAESLLFTTSGLTLLITTLFLGYYKKGLRVASKGLFTLLCLIGMWFNLLSIKNKTDYKPMQLKSIPVKMSWNEYHSKGHSWIAYKEYVESEYKTVLNNVKSENNQIKRQNAILYEKYKSQSEINYNEYIFFIGRGLFSILLIFAIDLIVILIIDFKSQGNSQKERVNDSLTEIDKSQSNSQSKEQSKNQYNENITNRIIALSKERYSNGVRKYTNHKIASLVDCEISFVDKLIQKRKYNKKKIENNKLYRIK